MAQASQPSGHVNGSILLRTAGLLAVAGGLVNAVSDYLLQGGLVARRAVNTYEFLPEAPYDLVFLGSILGNAAIPLWLLGFFPVYVALAPAGRWLSIPVPFGGLIRPAWGTTIFTVFFLVATIITWNVKLELHGAPVASEPHRSG